MRIASVVGNRPQFVKAAAVSPALRKRHEEVLIHTGQHHDAELSAVFFEELGLPAPDHSLDVFGGSNTSQLARMLEQLGPLLRSIAADAVLVYGDTNSTLAGALAAAGGHPLQLGAQVLDERLVGLLVGAELLGSRIGGRAQDGHGDETASTRASG